MRGFLILFLGLIFYEVCTWDGCCGSCFVGCVRFVLTLPYLPSFLPCACGHQFIDLVARGKEIMQFGDGSTSRDYTYISDIVDGVVRSLDRPAGYQIYNLGNGSPVSLSSFIGLVENSVGTPAKIRVMPEQPGDVPRTCADISKARSMLGYSPRVAFADGIRKTVDWYQARAAAAAAADANIIAGEPPVKAEPLLLPLRTSQPDGGSMGGSCRLERGRSASCASTSALDLDFYASILPKTVSMTLQKQQQQAQQAQQAPGPDGEALERATRTMSFAY